MAITINSIPESFGSFHDDMWVVATSTNATTTNMKYVFDIRINSVLVARLRVFPDPTTDRGIVNIGNIIRNYWSSYFFPSTTRQLFNYNGNGNIVTYTVQIGEDLNGTITTNLNQFISTAWNFAPPAFRDWAGAYYVNKLDNWLTNRDKNALTVYGDERVFISYAPVTPGDSSLAVTVNNGVSSMTGAGVFLLGLQMFDVSPAGVNQYLGTTFITPATQSYTLTISSDTIRVTRACTQYTPYSLHFLNELGGFDTFQFRLVNRQSRQFERKKYEQLGWALSGTTMTRSDAFKKLRGGDIQFSTKQMVKYTLTSDYVNETDYNWLRELLASPEVYYERDGYYYSVTITDAAWQEKKRINDKLFNLTINIDISTVNSQYR
jgi:hypothetical protein